jgi:predicted nucleotidyltransferase
MYIDMNYEKKYEIMVKDIVLDAVSNYDCKIFLFGSRAIGNFNRGSDYDIGVKGLDKKFFNKIYIKIIDKIEDSIIPHKIDVIDLDNVSPEFLKVAEKGMIEWK